MNSLVNIDLNNNELRNAKVKLSGTSGNITLINNNGVLSDASIASSDVAENIVTTSEFSSLYTKLGITASA